MKHTNTLDRIEREIDKRNTGKTITTIWRSFAGFEYDGTVYPSLEEAKAAARWDECENIAVFDNALRDV